MNGRRRAADGAYSVARHVEVLAALMGEARLLAASSAGRAEPSRDDAV